MPQSIPWYPPKHWQTLGPMHSPWLEHWLTALQSWIEQLGPDQPRVHSHVSNAMHRPFPTTKSKLCYQIYARCLNRRNTHGC